MYHGRNPLESGQCFSQMAAIPKRWPFLEASRRNPLESGQCFSLRLEDAEEPVADFYYVAIPSNRVNVSHS